MISLFLLVVEIRGLAYTLFLASSSAEVIRSSTLSLNGLCHTGDNAVCRGEACQDAGEGHLCVKIDAEKADDALLFPRIGMVADFNVFPFSY